MCLSDHKREIFLPNFRKRCRFVGSLEILLISPVINVSVMILAAHVLSQASWNSL